MAATQLLLDLGHDARLALRLLRRAPGFSVVAIATLALGIGASTAAFTVVNAVLLRPLPFADPRALTAVWTSAGSRVSPAYVDEWRRATDAYQDLAAWLDEPATLTGTGAPVEVAADRVTPNFFALLGVPALLGRTFTWEPTLGRVEPEVILSYGLWQRRYGGDPGVVGQAITVDGERRTVVGVMPPGVAVRTVELSQSRAELWLPRPLVPGDPIGMGGAYNVVGRLRAGVTPAQAAEQLLIISRRVERAHPSYSSDWHVRVLPLLDATVKDVRIALLVMAGAVVVLLVIACVNIASLVLSRAATRQTELAIRLALGASPGRLARQFLTESAVLAALGGSAGLVLASWATKFVAATVPAGFDLPRTSELGVDGRVLAFALGVTAVTAMIFGLAPALAARRRLPHEVAGSATRTTVTGGSRSDHGGWLVSSEVALAVMLLSSAGLLGRTVWNLSRVDAGFAPAPVLTLRTTLPLARYESVERRRAFGRAVLENIERLPGVAAAGTVSYLPMTRAGRGGPFTIAGRAGSRESDRPASWTSVVGGRYFDAMGIPLRRGRLPNDGDTATSPVVIVIDEQLARRYWPGADPIGARLEWDDGPLGPRAGEVIGVVGSVRWGGAAADPPGTVYHWFPQQPERQARLVVRAVGEPAALAASVTAAVTSVDPDQPVGEVRVMSDIVAADRAQPRFTLSVVGAFALAALILAAIGLYGVVAFNVSRRTREIGVRIALGAERGDVLRLVMRRGLWFVALGLAVGSAAAIAVGRVLASVLFEVTPADPLTLVAASLLLGGVAVLAIYVPARRATRVDPMVALRAE